MGACRNSPPSLTPDPRYNRSQAIVWLTRGNFRLLGSAMLTQMERVLAINKLQTLSA